MIRKCRYPTKCAKFSRENIYVTKTTFLRKAALTIQLRRQIKRKETVNGYFFCKEAIFSLLCVSVSFSRTVLGVERGGKTVSYEMKIWRRCSSSLI